MTGEPLRFEGVSIAVSDVARSVAFYRTLLGCTVEQQSSAFALLRLHDGSIGLLRTKMAGWPPEARAAVHLEFTTDDLDGLYATLQERGVLVDEPPHDAPWERAMATRDPDGYKVEFAQGRRGDNHPAKT